MSGQSSTTDADTGREQILEHLQTAIEALSRTIQTSDPTSIEEEEILLRRYHELGYLANQYRKLQKDIDIDRMDDRLEMLETNFTEN